LSAIPASRNYFFPQEPTDALILPVAFKEKVFYAAMVISNAKYMILGILG
jgi:hypothetical protein